MKKRLLFLTFWLWAIIIISILLVLVYALKPTNTYYDNHAVPYIICVILGLVNIVAAVLILKWKKLGFWIIVITGVVSLLVCKPAPAFVISSLIGLVVLVAMLQIKVDGVNCWEQLE